MKNEDFANSKHIVKVTLNDGKVVFLREEDFLTPENVIEKFKEYLDRIDKLYGNALPNLDVLWMFSFYMEYALHRTDLETARKLHDLIGSYLADREGNEWD